MFCIKFQLFLKNWILPKSMEFSISIWFLKDGMNSTMYIQQSPCHCRTNHIFPQYILPPPDSIHIIILYRQSDNQYIQSSRASRIYPLYINDCWIPTTTKNEEEQKKKQYKENRRANKKIKFSALHFGWHPRCVMVEFIILFRPQQHTIYTQHPRSIHEKRKTTQTHKQKQKNVKIKCNKKHLSLVTVKSETCKFFFFSTKKKTCKTINTTISERLRLLQWWKILTTHYIQVDPRLTKIIELRICRTHKHIHIHIQQIVQTHHNSCHRSEFKIVKVKYEENERNYSMKKTNKTAIALEKLTKI